MKELIDKLENIVADSFSRFGPSEAAFFGDTCAEAIAALQHLTTTNQSLMAEVANIAENCAKICDDRPNNKYYHPLSERQETYEQGRGDGNKECAKAIRAKYQALHAEEVKP